MRGFRALALAALLAGWPAAARAVSLEQSFSQARALAEELPRPVLRLPTADVRQRQSRVFLPKTMGEEAVGFVLGFSNVSGAPDDWGKFRVGDKEFVFLFQDLQKGVRREGLLFQLVYEDALILRVTRLADGVRAQATYVELLEMMAHDGPKVELGGLEFRLYVEEGDPIPASVALVQDRSPERQRAYRIYLRSGSLAGERITWFFTREGLEYGVRPEGDWIAFYTRPAL